MPFCEEHGQVHGEGSPCPECKKQETEERQDNEEDKPEGEEK